MRCFFPKRLAARAIMTALFLTLCCAGLAVADDAVVVTPALGGAPLTLKGQVVGQEEDPYILDLKAGQTLRVEVKDRAKLAYFRILLPNQDDEYLPKAGREDDALKWSGKIPADGKYTIVVVAMRMQGSPDVNYTLTVELKK